MNVRGTYVRGSDLVLEEEGGNESACRCEVGVRGGGISVEQLQCVVSRMS